ncbi:helix-turn-helix transcriptional regulator [Clostridium sp. 19966]|uniref:DUF5680 domain-containing protein n=1 Tax=Clostridium sp. 19966 TaxID=2768166 RepID=UPI0028DFB89F|nr:DUF5680 domain-containing protein [Clostridium sp. 19966]MDT8716818.1 helix-turn-helix transcriptional regulator [Clostridium sp. 19966]
MSFQEKLQKLRKDKGFSQEDLAEKLGVSRQAVAKWESGQSYPEIDKIISISKLFNITIDNLLKDFQKKCEENKAESINKIDDAMLEFLCRAKKATYAGEMNEAESSRPKSKDFQYSEGRFKYIDTYLGGEKFAGEEAVWKEGDPIWAMNYVGRIVAEGFSGKFLKEALKLSSKERPYRGPAIYENGDYKYHCIVTGDMEWFQGYEEIYYADIKVYECFFHGGSI